MPRAAKSRKPAPNALIFCGHECIPPELARRAAAGAHIVIAAHHALRSLLAADVRPSIVIGDPDSCPDESSATDAGVEVICRPPELDECDLGFAPSLAFERGADRCTIVSASPIPLRHALAHVCLAASRPGRVTFVCPGFTVAAAAPRRPCRATVSCDAPVAFFPFGPAADGVTATGLAQPLPSGSIAAAVSSRITAGAFSVSVRKGALIVCISSDAVSFA